MQLCSRANYYVPPSLFSQFKWRKSWVAQISCSVFSSCLAVIKHLSSAGKCVGRGCEHTNDILILALRNGGITGKERREKEKIERICTLIHTHREFDKFYWKQIRSILCTSLDKCNGILIRRPLSGYYRCAHKFIIGQFFKSSLTSQAWWSLFRFFFA